MAFGSSQPNFAMRNPCWDRCRGGAHRPEAIELAKPIVEDVASLDEIELLQRLNASIVAQVLRGRGCRRLCRHSFGCRFSRTRPGNPPRSSHGWNTPWTHTTDNVAIRLAIECGAARCLIATNVSHVYTSDPEN